MGVGAETLDGGSNLKYIEKNIIYNIVHRALSTNYKNNSVSTVQLLGVVQDISHDGKLIVKARFAPNPRALVRDNLKGEVGRISKVFGPTRSPYVAVTPRRDLKTLAVLGKEVYVQEERDHGKGKRRD
jgi:RNA-binding protein